jgi:hypothetical protein
MVRMNTNSSERRHRTGVTCKVDRRSATLESSESSKALWLKVAVQAFILTFKASAKAAKSRLPIPLIDAQT